MLDIGGGNSPAERCVGRPRPQANRQPPHTSSVSWCNSLILRLPLSCLPSPFFYSLLPTLAQIEAHEFAEQRLHMHFAAALTALQVRPSVSMPAPPLLVVALPAGSVHCMPAAPAKLSADYLAFPHPAPPHPSGHHTTTTATCPSRPCLPDSLHPTHACRRGRPTCWTSPSGTPWRPWWRTTKPRQQARQLAALAAIPPACSSRRWVRTRRRSWALTHRCWRTIQRPSCLRASSKQCLPAEGGAPWRLCLLVAAASALTTTCPSPLIWAAHDVLGLLHWSPWDERIASIGTAGFPVSALPSTANQHVDYWHLLTLLPFFPTRSSLLRNPAWLFFYTKTL